MYEEKISSLMVTQKSRMQFYKFSVNAWKQQTYPNKELVVVFSDGDIGTMKSIFGSITSKIIKLDGNPSLGAMRNASLDASRGDIVVPWDDDDFYHKDRLIVQYEKMRSDKTDASILNSQFYWFVEENRFYLRLRSFIHPTIMVRKKVVGRYPEIGENAKRGEDSYLVEHLRTKISNVDNMPWLSMRIIHGNNVWDSETHKGRTSRGIKISDITRSAKGIRETLDQCGIRQAIFETSEGYYEL